MEGRSRGGLYLQHIYHDITTLGPITCTLHIYQKSSLHSRIAGNSIRYYLIRSPSAGISSFARSEICMKTT